MRLDILIPHCLQSFTTSHISCSSVAEETVQVSVHMCLMVMGLQMKLLPGGSFSGSVQEVHALLLQSHRLPPEEVPATETVCPCPL